MTVGTGPAEPAYQPPSTQLITDEDIYELTGESELSDVRELNLRGRKLTTFEPWCSSLSNLEALSLSHNQFTSLNGLYQLHRLTHLNLNFNAITSLSGLDQCVSLQHLYLASNRVRDVSPLSACTRLETLHLFANLISSLDDTIAALCALHKLRDLDLSENPCANVPGYKEQVMQHLSIEVLDGEQVSCDDVTCNIWSNDQPAHAVNLPDNFKSLSPTLETSESLQVTEGATAAAATALAAVAAAATPEVLQSTPSQSGPGRPSTRNQPKQPTSSDRNSTSTSTSCSKHQPAGLGVHSSSAGSSGCSTPDRPSTSCSLPPAARQAAAAPRPGTAGTRPGTATCQLYSNDLLNDHPILLEYLAKHVLSQGMAVMHMGGPAGVRLRPSFVSRLRETAATMGATEGLDPKELAAKAELLAPHSPVTSSKATAIESLIMEATPHETIRQLVKLCEILIKEVEAARQWQPGSRPPSGRPGSASRPASATATAAAAGSAAAGAAAATAVQGGGGGAAAAAAAAASGEVPRLQAELDKLTRENWQLKQENQNVLWLAEEYKRMKSELRQAQALLPSQQDRV